MQVPEIGSKLRPLGDCPPKSDELTAGDLSLSA